MNLLKRGRQIQNGEGYDATAIVISKRQLMPRSLERRFAGLALADCLILLAFTAIAALAVCFHEPWSDEAQAWLIARDLGIRGIVHQMGYEGSPPLWHVLLWMLIRLHLPYSALGAASLTLVAAGMYIWLRWSPLPTPVRWLVPFAFYYQYQYAVVARSYALSTLLAFAAAALWRAKPLRVISFAVVVALLAQTNMHGFTIAAGIACAFAWEYIRDVPTQRPARAQTIRTGVAAVLVLASLAIARFLAQPYPDCSFKAAVQLRKGTALSSAAKLLSGLPAFSTAIGLNMTWGPSLLLGASIVLFILVLSWFVAVRRPVCALPFVFTVFAMGLVWARPWHYGMTLTAFLVSLWGAWPIAQRSEYRSATRILSISLAILLLFQLRLTAETVAAEVEGPYSGARATAEYLRPYVGKRPIYCVNFYGTGVQPYFKKNIFINWPTAYWTWSNRSAVEAKRILSESPPDRAIIVFPSGGQPSPRAVIPRSEKMELANRHFLARHAFCGAQFWMGRVSEYECYEIFERSAR